MRCFFIPTTMVISPDLLVELHYYLRYRHTMTYVTHPESIPCIAGLLPIIVVPPFFFRNPQTDAEEFFQDASLMMFSKFRHLLLGLAIYEGFLKWWYPHIIHFRLGFSILNHQIWIAIYG